jgi:hypothetical protein
VTPPTMHPAVAHARALITEGTAPVAAIAEAVAALCEVPLSFATRDDEDAAYALVEALIWASYKWSREIRIAAIRAMSKHPVSRLERRLLEMSHGDHWQEYDHDLEVRAAAEQAGKDMWTAMVACMQCGKAAAKLTPDESGDPNDIAQLFPVFCDATCAVAFALDVARERINDEVVHLCRLRGKWAPDSAASCHDCQDLLEIGKDIKVEVRKTKRTRKSRSEPV